MGILWRIAKWLGVSIGVLAVAVAIAGVLVVRALVEPDSDRFGEVRDEATRAGLTRTDFKAAGEPYFAAMDKGVLAAPAPGAAYPESIVAVAGVTGLSAEAVRQAAIRGQNTWNVWTGGNDRFWDWAAANTAGAFDLLKIVSSHPEQYYGRGNRFRYLGLVNEPCFEAPAGGDPDRFGLWLDVRDPSCAADPFADGEAYPGVRIGARGDTVPVGSAYGEPSGVIGLRLFPNPDFDADAAAAWDPERFYTDPDYYDRKDLVRPYRVGMSCAFCHVGPSPVAPPRDPENPTFAELASNPGAQYFWVDRIFFWNTRGRGPDNDPAPNEGNLLFQLFHTNPPGSLDTSLVSTDYMNNPRTMNAVYSVFSRLDLAARWGKERLTGDELANKQLQDYPQTERLSAFWNPGNGDVRTMRVLKDGADAVGALGALNRVYLNIGLFSEEWLLHFRPFIGGQKISPIRIADAQRNSAYWGATEDMTADMAIFFLVSASPDLLKDAPGGPDLLQPIASPTVRRGKIVFAETCAACHSSKIPEAPPEAGVDSGICEGGGNGPQYRECWDRYWAWANSDDFRTKMRRMVLADDFLDGNYLSTEKRIPLDLLQTNACSAIATNALKDDIWDNFSSATYKSLPPVKPVTVHHPVSGGTRSFQPLGNGRGYIRPASLVSLWSTGPFLLNNSVGHPDYYSDDHLGYSSRRRYGRDPGGYGAASCPAENPYDPFLPCVENRMHVFEDSIRKMLYPERRRRDQVTETPVPGYIYRSSAPFCVRIPAGYMPELARSAADLLYWAAPWAFDEKGGLALGPLPRDFPMNALLNTQLLPDNDQADMLGHYWRLAKAGPTFIGTFAKLGGACTPAQLRDPHVIARSETVVRESGLIDTLVGLSKCPDYVVNRGHTFGADLPVDDKEALISYLKHF